MSAVAVVGGTFDPVHEGHLAIAEQVRDLCGLDEAWLVPAGSPAHRPAPRASAQDRLDMCRAACAGRPRMRVLDLEVLAPGPSYTLDTLQRLQRLNPDTELWFVLGADAAREIRSWHRAGEVLASARLVVANRSGVGALSMPEATALGFDPARTRVVRIDSPPVSATEVRRRVAAGRPIDGLVPPAVAALITERGLYRQAVG